MVAVKEPLLTNDRARREWAWIVTKVGEPTAVAALERLGNQRPYPLNVAKILKISLPLDLEKEPLIQRHIGDFEALRHILKNGDNP